jgi:hypothetical protein
MYQIRSMSPPTHVAVLSYGGLIPFVSLCALEWIQPLYVNLWHEALCAYGAVILSFVGALHWGFAMLSNGLQPRARRYAYIWSVVPSLISWIALLIPPFIGSLLLVACLLVHYGFDVRMVKATVLPGWYLPLRWRLTVVAVMSILVGELGLLN